MLGAELVREADRARRTRGGRGRGAQHTISISDRIAANVPPGSDGVLIVPYFLGEKTPVHDPSARGTIDGLSLNHDLRHMWRALLEGFAYALPASCRGLRRPWGIRAGDTSPPMAVRNRGSGCRSAPIVLQAPVQLLTGYPGSCLGRLGLAPSRRASPRLERGLPLRQLRRSRGAD